AAAGRGEDVVAVGPGDDDAAEAIADERLDGEGGPARPAVGRLQDPVAVVAVPGEVALPGAGVEDEVVGRVDGQGADGQRDLVVGGRRPGLAAVRTLPHAALCGAGVNGPGVGRVEDDGSDPSGDVDAGAGVRLAVGNGGRAELHPVGGTRGGGCRL